MPYRSRWSLDPPVTSLQSFIFTSPTAPLPDGPIFISTERSTTHTFSLHQYREWSKRFAAGLVAAGLQTGDRVMLFSGNSIFTPIVIMGVIMAGGIYTSANPAFTPRELTYQLRDSGAHFLLAADNCVERALEGARLAGMEEDRVFHFCDLADLDEPTREISDAAERGERSVRTARSWRRLIASPETGRRFAWETFATREQADRTVILIYSSGTTGLPKGVEASHYNIVSNICQITYVQNLDPRNAVGPNTRGLCFLPMYHGLGLMYYAWVAPKRGLRVYLMDRFNLMDMLKNIQRFRITELLMVPPVVVAMAKSPLLQSGAYDLSSVRSVICGAAPLGMEVTVQFERLWPKGNVRVRQAWGMSESPCMLLRWDDREASAPTSVSVGELLPSAEAKIMDAEDTNEVPQGQSGELWCRSPNVMKGYWRNVKATEETLTKDGWLKTGDIAYVDQSGKFFIVDRKKELIKVRGAQVAPAELEALLLEHVAVADAAVVGAKMNGDECPRAYVVLRKKGSVAADDIVKFVEARVAKVKRITGGVVFLDVIPKNPSGKILRKVLRDRAARETRQQQRTRPSVL